MKQTKIAVIGGGGAGILAAIAAARKGAEVLVAERMSLLGKKVLASGAGRCNLLNETLDASFYNEEAAAIVDRTFRRFGKEDILSFFRELGLWTHTEEDGRIFPLTDKALTLMELLRAELDRLGVGVRLNCPIRTVKRDGEGFLLETENGEPARADRVILAAGGRSYPNLGSDGSGFALASSFGHRIVEPVPATVPLVSQDVWCRVLDGQKIRARACPLLDSKEVMPWIEGDVLFTNYGLSGTAILDISDPISVGLNRAPAKKAAVVLDLVPFLDENALLREFERRLGRGMKDSSLVAGLLPPKFAQVLRGFFFVPEKIRQLASVLKHRLFYVSGTRGWDAAEFTAGGVAVPEIEPETFESKKKKNLYLCGEVVDVNGRRGGYQLAWAWSSGYLAGLAAAR
jgi:predicted Rossmann fold flavoprotein